MSSLTTKGLPPPSRSTIHISPDIENFFSTGMGVGSGLGVGTGVGAGFGCTFFFTYTS